MSEIFPLPKNAASVYVSTHFELGRSDLLHYHDEPHLTFILNGGVIDKRKPFENERFGGELMFFRAGEPHQTISKMFPTKYVSLQFQSDFFKQNPHLELAIENNFDSKISLLKIYRELTINDEFSETSLEILLQNLIQSPADGKIFPAWLKKIVELLNDRWNDEISLEDLAFAAEVHPKTISKYFPRFFGCTLGEYRRRIKIEKSFALIKSAKFSLTDIAYQCNFYDQSHFTKTFKDLTGFLPKQFQKL